MQIIKRGRNTFYIKEFSVIVGTNDGLQYIAYTVYPLQNRKPFYDFQQELINSPENKYGTVTDIVLLAMQYNLTGIGSHKPSQEEIDEAL